MRIGIVGHESAKFDLVTEAKARKLIQDILISHGATHVVSGGCHLGGIDIWAVEEAKRLNIPFTEHKPQNLMWSPGYKERNIKIAEDSDAVFCIVVRDYPKGYTGMRFGFCYHCKNQDHIKSGGCWTAKYARGLGKQGLIAVI